MPQASNRLLCPQQLLQEFDPSMKPSTIGTESVTLYFSQGEVECPYDSSNLPIIQLSSKEEFDSSVKALNSCLLQKNNHNLKAAHKELLRWHWKFGHLNLPKVQAILRSGVCGNTPLIKAAAHLNLQTDKPSADHASMVKPEGAAQRLPRPLLPMPPTQQLPHQFPNLRRCCPRTK